MMAVGSLRALFLLVLASTVMISGPVGNVDGIFVTSRLLRCVIWGLIFNERRCHSSSTEE
jgi:hypothetical protein